MIGKFVIIRGNNSGVHTGFLKDFAGQQATLTGHRRIWSWSGANTLNEIALAGCGDESRISMPVPIITVTDVLEVIPCSPVAQANLENSRWH
jgi:hypothetical protein